MSIDNMDISVIIVDDDPKAIDLLQAYLRHFSNVRVVDVSTNAIAGLSLIIEQFPDLVFLDIDMPDMNGLQVAEAVKTKKFYSEIVFTTAHQHYAYKALTVEPLDFLTKPFSSADLEKVIKKFQDKAEKKKYEQKIDQFIQSQTYPQKISLPVLHSFLIVDINDIVYLKANKNTTFVYLQDGTTETVYDNARNLVRMLNSNLIFQIHRATYINLNYLQRIDKKKSICIMRFNNSLREEAITRENISIFENLNQYPGI